MRSPSKAFHILLTLLFIAAGALGLMVLTLRRPQLEKHQAPVLPPVVRFETARAGPVAMHVLGEGVVQPLSEITLMPQISGIVREVSPNLVNGGAFAEGEVLVRIDPTDYDLAVRLARANLTGARARLDAAARSFSRSKNLLPRQVIAQSKFDETEAEYKSAQATLETRQAELDRAEVNLARTVITAPFAGRVSKKNVGPGQHVATGQSLATIFPTEAMEIVVPLPDDALAWIQVPGFSDGDGPGAAAEVSAVLAGERRVWPGRVMRTQGRLDETTRLVNVVVRVEDPYRVRPPLAPGLFVRVELAGRSLETAVELPRAALREDSTVWVVEDDDRLRIRPVVVARIQGDRFTVSRGLADGDRVVTSLLKGVTDGMRVRGVARKEPS